MTILLSAIVIFAAGWATVRLLQVRALGQRLMEVQAMNSNKQRSTARG